METISLHSQKVALLSRLIKADKISLEEALLLLKQEDEVGQPLYPQPHNPSPTYPYWQPSPWMPTIVSGGSNDPILTNTSNTDFVTTHTSN